MTEIVEVIMTQFSMIIKAPGQTAQPDAPANRLRGNSPSFLVRLTAHLRAETYKAEPCIFLPKEKVHAFLNLPKSP